VCTLLTRDRECCSSCRCFLECLQDYLRELEAHIKSREELQELQDRLKVMEDQKEVALTSKEVLAMKVTSLVVFFEEVANELNKEIFIILSVLRPETAIAATLVGHRRPASPSETGGASSPKRPKRIVHLVPCMSQFFLLDYSSFFEELGNVVG
jgi:hypothetical protein